MLAEKSNNPRCVGVKGWIIYGVVEEAVEGETKTFEVMEFGSKDRYEYPDVSLISLKDNQKLVSYEMVFCGCDPGFLEFKKFCLSPCLSRTSSTCQEYDNPPTIKEMVQDYYVKNDDDKIARRNEIEGSGVCTYRPPTTTQVNGRWSCPDPEDEKLMNEILFPGEWVYKEVEVPNPSYNPDWLAVNKRILRLRQSTNPESKFYFSNRFIFEKINNEIVYVYNWSNFIKSIDFIFCGEEGGEYCTYRGQPYEGWLGVIEYECLQVSAPGESHSGSGSGDSGVDSGRCGGCEIASADCCIDMKVLTEYLNQLV